MTARPVARSTCPWGDNGQPDRDTALLEAASRKRATKNDGGYGGHKAPSSRVGSGASRTSSRHSRPGTSGEEKALQMQQFVQQCLDQGYGEDEIEGLWQQFRQSRTGSSAVLSQATPAHPNSMAAVREKAKETSHASVQSYDEARSRQAYMQGQKEAAEAKRRNAAGAGLLSHMSSDQSSIGSRREKTKESSEASVQSYDEEKSRLAYLQGQKEAAESKRKNAAGLGIF